MSRKKSPPKSSTEPNPPSEAVQASTAPMDASLKEELDSIHQYVEVAGEIRNQQQKIDEVLGKLWSFLREPFGAVANFRRTDLEVELGRSLSDDEVKSVLVDRIFDAVKSLAGWPTHQIISACSPETPRPLRLAAIVVKAVLGGATSADVGQLLTDYHRHGYGCLEDCLHGMWQIPALVVESVRVKYGLSRGVFAGSNTAPAKPEGESGHGAFTSGADASPTVEAGGVELSDGNGGVSDRLCGRVTEALDDQGAQLKPQTETKGGGTIPPLTNCERAVLDQIPRIAQDGQGKGITGKEIVEALANTENEIDQNTLTTHVIPKLKKWFGVINPRGGRGYFIPIA